MKNKLLFSLLALMLSFSAVMAQTIIRGKVIDTKDKEGVIGASVVEIDKDNRTINGVSTDIDGNFALRVSNMSNRVKVSIIGYEAVTVAINGRTVINVSLKSTSQSLETVVITGRSSQNIGILNIDPKHNTMSTVTVSTKELEELSAASIDQALVGRMPGVDFGSTSGDPGAGMSIRIRGTATLNGNAQPLIVLDGMIYETQIPSDFNFGNADEQSFASLLSVAPTDIKDITVLKDAASTAMWGSRAANGVLVVNTKRGTVGKPQISYSFKGAFQKQPNTFPMLSGDEYATLIPEMVRNQSGIPMDINQFPEFAYDKFNPSYFYNYNKNTDWLGEITQIGLSGQHDVNIRGGGEKARYYASVGYLGNKGTTVGTALARITTRVNLDYNVSDKIKFSSDFAYTHTTNDLNYTNPRGQAYIKMPQMSPYLYDDYGNPTSVYFSPERNIQGEYPKYYNPVAMAEAAISHSIGERLTPSFTLQYRLSPAFNTDFRVRFDINNTKSNNFLPQMVSGKPITEAYVNNAQDSDGDAFATSGTLNLYYTPKFESLAHVLTVTTSLQANQSSSSSSFLQSTNTASLYFQDPTNPARITGSETGLSSGIGLSRNLGAYFSAHYTLLDRYDINLGLRADGNSRTAPDYRFTMFPSLSARWHLSDEKFIKKHDFRWLEDLSVRASYGISGNPPNASYYNIYTPTSFLTTPLNTTYANEYLGQAGIVSSNLQVSNLRTEKLRGLNLGFDLWMFTGRVKFGVDLYKNVTTDLLLPGLSIPSYTGFSSVASNNGKITNTGMEFLLQTTPVKTKAWLVNMDFNFAKNQNVVNEISEYYPRESSGNVTDNGKYKTFLQLGNPFGSFYGYKTRGVYKDAEATIAKDERGNQVLDPNGKPIYMRFNYPATNYVFQPGDIEYVDINHDGNINYMDQVYLGNGIPKITGGFGQTVTYKGTFTLRTYFNFRYKYDIINGAKMSTTNMYTYDNQSTAVLRRWRNPGDVTDIPRALRGSGYNWLGSDRFVEDASFLRLGQLTLNYAFPKSLVNKFKMQSLRAYVTAENLITFTNYTGQNPDVALRDNNTNAFSYPVDNSNTPPSRNLVFGLTANF